MNITITYLFNLINFNDYEKLAQIIDSNKGKEYFHKRKSSESLISKAITVRARQCFDLLLTINFDMDNQDFYQRGLYNAIEYYVNAPNSDNKYYLDKIMEKPIIVDFYIMYKTIKNTELFIKLFDRYHKDIDNLNKVAICSIMNNNIETFEIIYNYISSNFDINNLLLNELYNQAIHSNNITCIEFLISKNLNYTHVNDYPAIYLTLNPQTMLSFDYLYKKYKTLTKEELNSIPSIKNKLPINFQFNLKTFNNLKKILTLPIDFSDMDTYVATTFTYLYKLVTHTSPYYNRELCKNFKEKYNIIETLFEHKLVKSNPLLLINTEHFMTYYKKNLGYLNGYPDHIENYTNNIKKFLGICEKYNYKSDIVL